MRTIVGYIDGKAVWTNNVPSEAAIKVISGSLVVGESASDNPKMLAAKAREAKRRAA